jgi:hypothetical protein
MSGSFAMLLSYRDWIDQYTKFQKTPKASQSNLVQLIDDKGDAILL